MIANESDCAKIYYAGTSLPQLGFLSILLFPTLSKCSKRKKPIITWVFKYKFDDQGFLTKYKACLSAREDLQHIA